MTKLYFLYPYDLDICKRAHKQTVYYFYLEDMNDWSDVGGVWEGRRTGGKWNNSGGSSACVLTQVMNMTSGSCENYPTLWK